MYGKATRFTACSFIVQKLSLSRPIISHLVRVKLDFNVRQLSKMAQILYSTTEANVTHTDTHRRHVTATFLSPMELSTLSNLVEREKDCVFKIDEC